MTEDQSSSILQAISDSRQEATTSIGNLAVKVGEYHADLHARVSTLERKVSREETHQWINTMLVPFYALMHAIASHLGIKS